MTVGPGDRREGPGSSPQGSERHVADVLREQWEERISRTKAVDTEHQSKFRRGARLNIPDLVP